MHSNPIDTDGVSPGWLRRLGMVVRWGWQRFSSSGAMTFLLRWGGGDGHIDWVV